MSFETSLRVDCLVKPHYHELVRTITEEGWSSALKKFPNLSFLQTYAKLPRFDCIPSMPGWDSAKQELAASSKFSDGRWAFHCAFKNFDQEIENFVTLVLLEVASTVVRAEYTNDNLGVDEWYPVERLILS